MNARFIKNEQFNFIKKQLVFIQDSIKKNLPPDVLSAVVDLSHAKILSLFPEAASEQRKMLDPSELKSDQEFRKYIEQISVCVEPFPQLTEQQLRKIFPKHKKLKLPDLAAFNLNRLTYLSWNDLRSNKKFIVYELDGKLVGIEGNVNPSSKQNVCSFCNGVEKVAYFSTVTKAKKAQNPDYFRSIGNLICSESKTCNQNITDTAYLEQFLKNALNIL